MFRSNRGCLNKSVLHMASHQNVSFVQGSVHLPAVAMSALTAKQAWYGIVGHDMLWDVC